MTESAVREALDSSDSEGRRARALEELAEALESCVSGADYAAVDSTAAESRQDPRGPFLLLQALQPPLEVGGVLARDVADALAMDHDHDRVLVMAVLRLADKERRGVDLCRALVRSKGGHERRQVGVVVGLAHDVERLVVLGVAEQEACLGERGVPGLLSPLLIALAASAVGFVEA